ncbi:hypothetical protein D9756_005646 [Leucocoprinus leucothites]|uniref:Uncharacterized protein n=1 Tax=Leucocoprinus leucothites TaxID=201217 RepID=A0A8H5D7A1_9AGAR|nr:hypothetical protein D9756_005646 [Leucoagaricus leucothites]
MFSKILNSPYLPHAIYSLAITSISIHLVSQKRNIAEDKARVTARISILESVSKELREDKDISLDELDRLHRLARPPAPKENGGRIKEVIRWKEVFLGPKRSAGPEMSDLDRQDWEKIKEELEPQK